MHSYAQTNIQLLNQLSREGYSNAELQDIFRAYQLTMKLFTGQFRASGKTFIAHLVGTASILARLRVSSQLISAALLHAAYAQGDFGGKGKRGISEGKRHQVRQIVGDEVERYINRYTLWLWDEAQIAHIHQNVSQFNDLDRDTISIRLANELEEYLDLGIIYCGESKYQAYSHHQRELLIEIAEKLGYPSLAAEFRDVFRQIDSVQIPPELCNPTQYYRSAIIPPQSYQRKIPVWLYQKLGSKIAYWGSRLRRASASSNVGLKPAP